MASHDRTNELSAWGYQALVRRGPTAVCPGTIEPMLPSQREDDGPAAARMHADLLLKINKPGTRLPPIPKMARPPGGQQDTPHSSVEMDQPAGSKRSMKLPDLELLNGDHTKYDSWSSKSGWSGQARLPPGPWWARGGPLAVALRSICRGTGYESLPMGLDDDEHAGASAEVDRGSLPS